jgi:hypothetical protein
LSGVRTSSKETFPAAHSPDAIVSGTSSPYPAWGVSSDPQHWSLGTTSCARVEQPPTKDQPFCSWVEAALETAGRRAQTGGAGDLACTAPRWLTGPPPPPAPGPDLTRGPRRRGRQGAASGYWVCAHAPGSAAVPGHRGQHHRQYVTLAAPPGLLPLPGRPTVILGPRRTRSDLGWLAETGQSGPFC